MATSKQELRTWFDKGVASGYTHMIVVCDTFDHMDFPVYVLPSEDVKSVERAYAGQAMARIMEVYNLSMDREQQLAEVRAFNY